MVSVFKIYLYLCVSAETTLQKATASLENLSAIAQCAVDENSTIEQQQKKSTKLSTFSSAVVRVDTLL